jgi:hypothetical protein
VMPAGRPSIGALEVAALLLITVGAFALPIIGPIVGILLVWASRVFTRGQKLILTAVVGVVFVLPIVGLVAVRGGGG